RRNAIRRADSRRDSLRPPDEEAPRFEAGQRAVEPFGTGAVTTGIVEARQKFQLRVRQATARAFQFERKGITAMPEQQVARARQHAHALEAGGLARVALAAVRNMEPENVRLGAQAQVFADGDVDRVLGMLPAARDGLIRV